MKGLIWLLRKYNYVLVFIVLETIAILLLSNHNAYQRSIIANIHREISGRIYDRAEGAREYLHLRKNNDILVKENAVLRTKLLAASSNLSDSVFPAYRNSSYFFTPARIVNGGQFKQYNFLTIDKGKKQGISRDMGVIGEEGIVGIVLESSANYSTVIPIINRDFRLSVKILENNFSGILQWGGTDLLEASLNEIPYHAEVSVGDSIVTSGFSAIFPEGLYVGKINSFSVSDENFYNIKVDLATDYKRLFHVNVINNFLQEEQRNLESKIEQ